MAHAPRNRPLAPGIMRFSRSKAAARRANHKRCAKLAPAVAAAPAAAAAKSVSVKGAGNGSTRTIALNKAPKWYPAESVSRPLANRKNNRSRLTRLRANITPGTVLILLAGRFRGKRVVFLKQLPTSGLLLVTGPYKVNGVPMRRVNQAYVIATSSKVDVCGVNTAKFDDAYFKKEKACKKDKTEEAFFEGAAKAKKALPEHRVADQKEVDAPILKALAKDNMMRTYLAASFSLSKGQFPHAMKF